MTLAEIAEASALPARTIRFYIARGLLNGPVKGGRGATYTTGHLALLNRIRNLQSIGRTLSEIARLLGGRSQEPAVSQPTTWWQHAVADDIVVWVKAGAAPWRMKQVRTALDEFARQVQPVDNGTTGKEQGTKCAAQLRVSRPLRRPPEILFASPCSGCG
jgi:DNA-binding transcriptional MerR regulator